MKRKVHDTSTRRNRVKRHRAGNDSPTAENACSRILKAARRVFSLHSFKAASTRTIAQEAGVDHPLIHYHFGSKEKLFEAVTSEIYEEFGQAHLSWLEGLERMRPREGLSLYLDRLLDHNLSNPEALQIIFLNMVHIGRLEEIPGYQYILQHMDRVRRTLEEKIPLHGSRADMKMFIHCFHNLLISLIGARSCQAQILGLDPDGSDYQTWVKQALLLLFLPWLERLISPDAKPQKAHRPA